MHLAYSQGVDLRYCKKWSTLQNVYAIISPGVSNLGYRGPTDITKAPPSTDCMESLILGVYLDSDSDSEGYIFVCDSEKINEKFLPDDSTMRLEWEAISSATDETEVEVEPVVTNSVMASPIFQHTTSIASGILSTATSFWRGSIFKMK